MTMLQHEGAQNSSTGGDFPPYALTLQENSAALLPGPLRRYRLRDSEAHFHDNGRKAHSSGIASI